jgi:hypothetical protein
MQSFFFRWCGQVSVFLYILFWVIPRRLNLDAGELPRRKHTTFTIQRKFAIKNTFILCNVAIWRCTVTLHAKFDSYG